VNRLLQIALLFPGPRIAQEQPKDEKGNPDFSKFGPFSKTMIVNDLTEIKAILLRYQISAKNNYSLA